MTTGFKQRTAQFGYAEDTEVQVLELPYEGGETSMVVVLPRKRGGLAATEKALTAEKLRNWLGRLRKKQTQVAFPRFAFGWSASHGPTLADHGMKGAFGGQADFVRIATSSPLSVSDVLHKARIEVNEKGTVAAAATAVLVWFGGPSRTEATVTADHPFLFLIRHRRTGTILFIGCVEDPTKE